MGEKYGRFIENHIIFKNLDRLGILNSTNVNR